MIYDKNLYKKKIKLTNKANEKKLMINYLINKKRT